MAEQGAIDARKVKLLLYARHIETIGNNTMASNDTERVTAATCPSSFLPTGYPYIPERDFSSAVILHHLRCTAVLQTWAWGLQDAGAHKEAIRAALSESASMSHVMAITREALQAGELARRAEVEDAKERELQLLRGY